jgi:hypothetical protein
MNNKQKILNSIASRTRTEKPIGSFSMRLLRYGAITACVSLLAGAIILVGLFVFDIFEKTAIEQFLNQNIYSPMYFLFEYLVVALVLIVIFVYLYRKFDWPLVKEKNMIFIISILVSLFVGLGIASGAEHLFFLRKSLQTVKDTYVAHMPLRRAQIATTGAALQNAGSIIGTVSKIVENSEEISISITMKGVETTYVMKESSVTEKLRVGEKVAVQIDADQKTITKIKIIK